MATTNLLELRSLDTVVQSLQNILRYRKTYSLEVTDVNFEDKSPAEGLPVLTTERSFQKRWVSLLSTDSALRLLYPFCDHCNFDKAMLSKSPSKLHLKIDSLQDPNGLGVYRCKMLGGYFFTIQDLMLTPPEMSTT
jgi:glutaredoxin